MEVQGMEYSHWVLQSIQSGRHGQKSGVWLEQPLSAEVLLLAVCMG